MNKINVSDLLCDFYESFNTLTDRQKEVMRLRFSCKTLEQVGQEMGVTREHTILHYKLNKK